MPNETERTSWRSGIRPPQDITAARLFRLLSGRERARFRLTYRLPFAPTVELWARALTTGEWCDAVEDGEEALVSAACWSDEGQVFPRAPDLGGLFAQEFSALSEAVVSGLGVCCPVSGYCLTEAWLGRLRDGAKQRGNISTAHNMAACVDVANGYGVRTTIQRPDRYYGIPRCELTDGQLLAFRAGVEVASKES